MIFNRGFGGRGIYKLNIKSRLRVIQNYKRSLKTQKRKIIYIISAAKLFKI